MANLKIDEIKHTIYNLERELMGESESYDAESLKLKFLKKQAPKMLLIDLMKMFVSHYTKNETLAARTVQTYNTRMNGLVAYLEYANISTLLAEKVNLEFVKNFEYYLKDKKYEFCYILKSASKKK